MARARGEVSDRRKVDIDALCSRADKLLAEKRLPGDPDSFFAYIFNEKIFNKITELYGSGWSSRRILEWLRQGGVAHPDGTAMSIATLEQYYSDVRKHRDRARAAGQDPNVMPPRKMRRKLPESAFAVPSPSSASAPRKPLEEKAADVVLPAVEAPMSAPVEVETVAVTPRKPARALADDENRAPVKPVVRDLEDV